MRTMWPHLGDMKYILVLVLLMVALPGFAQDGQMWQDMTVEEQKAFARGLYSAYVPYFIAMAEDWESMNEQQRSGIRDALLPLYDGEDFLTVEEIRKKMGRLAEEHPEKTALMLWSYAVEDAARAWATS